MGKVPLVTRTNVLSSIMALFLLLFFLRKGHGMGKKIEAALWLIELYCPGGSRSLRYRLGLGRITDQAVYKVMNSWGYLWNRKIKAWFLNVERVEKLSKM
jgi:hypothetical protein